MKIDKEKLKIQEILSDLIEYSMSKKHKSSEMIKKLREVSDELDEI